MAELVDPPITEGDRVQVREDLDHFRCAGSCGTVTAYDESLVWVYVTFADGETVPFFASELTRLEREV